MGSMRKGALIGAIMLALGTAGSAQAWTHRLPYLKASAPVNADQYIRGYLDSPHISRIHIRDCQPQVDLFGDLEISCHVTWRETNAVVLGQSFAVADLDSQIAVRTFPQPVQCNLASGPWQACRDGAAAAAVR